MTYPSGIQNQASGGWRQYLISFALLVLACLAGWYFFWPVSSPSHAADPHEEVVSQLNEICPDSPLLVRRMAAERLYVALKIARQEGCPGLRAVDEFGDEAVELFEKKPEAFHQLASFMELKGALFVSGIGPWRKPLLQWAWSDKLRHYIEACQSLSDDERELLRIVPASLPLLLCDNVRIARLMLREHGDRAWRLFSLVDFVHYGTEGIERLAAALDFHGTNMLDVNDRYGLAAALFFVPPSGDRERIIPRLYETAVDRLGIEEAFALFLTNHDDLIKMVLKDSRTLDELRAAVEWLSTQPPAVRAMAADSPYAMRLLTTRINTNWIGPDVFSRCGPLAANLLYRPDGFGWRPVERVSTLRILKHEGGPACQFLAGFSGSAALQELLRREELQGPPEDPLLARVIHQVVRSADKSAKLERFNKMPRSQIIELQSPPTTGEKIASFIPLYTAYKVTSDALHGYQVSTTDVAFAVAEVALTTIPAAKLVSTSVKVVGKKGMTAATRKTMKGAAEQATEAVAKKQGKKGTRSFLSRVPSGMLSIVRNLPPPSRLDVTQIARMASSVGKKVGVRTWGRLDRRIIMRGDRRVVIDIEELSRKAREELKSEVLWGAAGGAIGELAPWIMEQAVPKLKIAGGT